MARVLIVDDDPGIREVIGFVVEDAGHSIIEAADGQSALDFVKVEHPDLIVLDMKMPGMDGWEFARQYRALYGKRAAILVLTASREAAARSDSIEAEAVLPKPFDLDLLTDQISRLLTRFNESP